MNICNGIHQNFEALGTAFNFIVPQATAAQEFVEDMKQKAEDHSNFFNEMMNVQVPNFVEYLENAGNALLFLMPVPVCDLSFI